MNWSDGLRTGLPLGQDAADYVVANGSPELVHSLVSLRGRHPYRLSGRSHTTPSSGSILRNNTCSECRVPVASGDNTVAERVARPVDRAQQLAGNIWFYYGSRYGEYTGLTRQGSPEDFLPAFWNRVREAPLAI